MLGTPPCYFDKVVHREEMLYTLAASQRCVELPAAVGSHPVAPYLSMIPERTVCVIPTKIPCLPHQFVGSPSSSLRQPVQVLWTGSPSRAFFSNLLVSVSALSIVCLRLSILWSRFLFSLPPLLLSLIRLSFLNFHIRYAVSGIRIRYSLALPVGGYKGI